jgi:hypothetical protein
MKSVIGPVLVALVLAAAGGASWAVGTTETRLVEAHAQLATLQYANASTTADGAEQAGVGLIVKSDMLGLGRRLAALDPSSAADARDVHAASDYWGASYAAIAPRKDAAGLVVETDTAILVLAANAGFRASQAATDRTDALRRIDAAVKGYAELLKSDGGSADAAYNYEFAIRTREALAKPRPAAAPKVAARAADSAPTGPTLHGRPGGPPPATDMTQFRVVIPKRSDERNDAPEAGKGGTRVRKG